MFVVDTNILIYAANADCEEHVACRELLEKWRAGAVGWYVTWGILYEFLRVVTHPRVLEHPWTLQKAWQFIEGLLQTETLSVLVETDRHAAVVAKIVAGAKGFAGNVMHDTHTAALMMEHGIGTIYTRDSDFNRFGFLRTVDPLRENHGA